MNAFKNFSSIFNLGCLVWGGRIFEIAMFPLTTQSIISFFTHLQLF